MNGEEPPEGGGDIIPPDDNDPEEDEEPDDPVISPSTPTVELTKAVDGEVEDEVTLSIDIKNNPGIISAQFYVDYDKDALTLINVKVKNMTDAAFIYVAGYSDNGRMLAVRMADENGNTDFSKELSIDYFKTFLWSAQEIPLDMAVITNLD